MHKIATLIIAGLAVGVAGTASSAAEKNSVTIGGGPYLDVPQIAQAMDKNLWKNHGVSANVVSFRTGRAAGTPARIP